MTMQEAHQGRLGKQAAVISARVVAPHMPNTPGRIVYSLGGLRDDSETFCNYFGQGSFPDWDPDLHPAGPAAAMIPANGIQLPSTAR
jgi:hypothetical protein